MNRLTEQGKVEEQACGANFAYVLNNVATFSSTEYKVLQSQGDGCFIHCMKLLYNGRMQFYYLTAGYRSLESMLLSLDAEKFMMIAAGILSSVVQIKSNGFLSCCNVDLSYDKIFVDINTYKVRLVYLPVNEGFFQDGSTFESELRTGLIRAISMNAILAAAPTMQQLASDLANGLIPLESLVGHMHLRTVPKEFEHGKEERPQIDSFRSNDGRTISDKGLRLESLNASEKIVLFIDKDNYIIGKNPARVDGVLSFNRMISRVHCKIVRSGEQYSIEDLGSANGTYVNGTRVFQNQTVSIRNGDTVRLANSDFQVMIR